jgi:hypothetical protein
MIRRLAMTGLGSALTLCAVFLVPAELWTRAIVALRSAVSPPSPPLPPSIAQIQGMSELATTRVHISDFIEGISHDYRGRWMLHGEILLGVDLSQVAYIRANPEKREAVLGLPSPHVIATKIDHERSDEIKMEWISWSPLASPKSLRDEVWKRADRKLQELGQNPGYMERARVQTERALGRLFSQAGWTVSFVWDDEPQAGSSAPARAADQAEPDHLHRAKTAAVGTSPSY